MTRIVTIIALLFATPVAACYEPSEPSCQNSPFTFEDSFSFEMCRNELESYSSEVEDYVACLKRRQNEAIDEFNDGQYAGHNLSLTIDAIFSGASK